MHRNLENPKAAELIIRNKTIVRENCTLISCEIGSSVEICAGSVICEGAKIGNSSIIGPNSVVPPNRVIPSNQYWEGNPVRFVKHISRAEEIDSQRKWMKLA